MREINKEYLVWSDKNKSSTKIQIYCYLNAEKQ